MSAIELAVIGAGPSGLAAAREAASHGVEVAMIDDNALPGGQYYRQAATPALRHIAGHLFDESEIGKPLLDAVRDPRIRHLSQATVFGLVDDGVLAYVRDGRVESFKPRAIVVATGATERPVPFPGWTLPGIMGAGAAQNLMKSQRVVPGRRILVAGNGPLALLAAANLARLGATVVEVLEASRPRSLWRQVPGLLMEPGILARGIGYRAALLRRGVLFRNGEVVIEAMGSNRVEAARVAPIDATGAIDRHRARVLTVDTVITGFGLVPAAEFTRASGCVHRYDSGKGGWIPVRSPDLQTTRDGIYAVGECAGAAGVEKALIEGRLAGLAVAIRLGRAKPGGAQTMRRLQVRLARLERFRRAIEAIYVAPLSYSALVTDDTIVCRCEEVTGADVRRRLDDGATESNSLKAVTRMSMGRCQGRNCLPTLARLVAERLGTSVEDVPLPRPRPPMRPVSVASLVAEPGTSRVEPR